jgi:hypothetical protein
VAFRTGPSIPLAAGLRTGPSEGAAKGLLKGGTARILPACAVPACAEHLSACGKAQAGGRQARRQGQSAEPSSRT